jgi:hypothetical protein
VIFSDIPPTVNGADRAEFDELLGLLAPRPVRMVVLSPGIQVCRDRNATRDPSERFDFDGYEHLDAKMIGNAAAISSPNARSTSKVSVPPGQ